MADIRYYIDADLIALGKSLVQARYDTTYAGDPGDPSRGRPKCPIRRQAKDPEWIPEVAARHWIVISRDRQITKKSVEINAVKENALRLVVLDVRRDPTTWGELGIAVARWSDIERVTALTGPRIFIATRTSFRELALK
ncbi:MAG: hypothetical protein WD646_09870 [Actinomycetota bacterium]